MEISAGKIYRNGTSNIIAYYKDKTSNKYSWDIKSTTRAYFKMNDVWDSAGNFLRSPIGKEGSLGRMYGGEDFSGTINYHKNMNSKFVSLWFRADGAVNGKHMQLPFCDYGGITYNYDHTTAASRQSFQYHISGVWPKTYVTTNPNTWYYLAYGITEDEEMFFYVNDQRTSMGQVPSDIQTDKAVFAVANNTTYYMELSDVLIETEARPDEEIITYYNNTKSLYGY